MKQYCRYCANALDYNGEAEDIESGLLQNAVYAQIDIDRIVWKLNKLNGCEPTQVESPQTDCNTNQCVQRIEYIGDIEKKRCRTCKHFESEFHTPISSDGTYYPYVICKAKECHYESVDTPQTDCLWK